MEGWLLAFAEEAVGAEVGGFRRRSGWMVGFGLRGKKRVAGGAFDPAVLALPFGGAGDAVAKVLNLGNGGLVLGVG